MPSSNTNPFINIINSKVNKQSKMIRQYVDIINVLLNLTNREMDVLALFMEIDLDWDKTKNKDIIDADSRKYVMQETLMNKANLSRYITILKGKDAIVKLGDGWGINEKILPVINDNSIQVHFNLQLNGE